jgi:hypothetical protein
MGIPYILDTLRPIYRMPLYRMDDLVTVGELPWPLLLSGTINGQIAISIAINYYDMNV